MDHALKLEQTRSAQSPWWRQIWANLTHLAEAIEADQTGLAADRMARIEARLAALEATRRGQ